MSDPGKMLSIKFKDVILETIDQLRKRKARPDLDRISNMLQRKHGISFEDTEAILEKLVDSEVVFKVDYKGSTSYRNAAKWRINHIGGQVHNSNQSNQKIRALGQQPSNNSTSTFDVVNVSQSVASPGNRKNNSSSRSTHVNVVDTKELNSTSATSSDSRPGKAASNYQCSENKTCNRGVKKENVNVTTTATILKTSSPCYTSTLSTRQMGRNSRKEQASSKTTNNNVRRNSENWHCKENRLTETLAFTGTQNGNESEWDKKLLINDNSTGDVITDRENDSNNYKNNDNNSNEKHTSCTLTARHTVHRRNMNNTLISTRTVNNYNGDNNNNGNDENGINSSSGVEDYNGGDGGDDEINTSCNKFEKDIVDSHFLSSAELVHDALSKLKSSLSSGVTVTTAGVTDTSKSSPSIGSCQGRRENRQQSAVLSKPGHPCRNSKEKQLQNKASLPNAQPRGNRMTKTAIPVAPVLARRGRPVSKRKRIRKTHGPEFESEDILKFDEEKCVSCLLTADRNKHGQPEELLVCKDCNITVHPSCMDYCEELATRARNSPWQCIECKTCFVCDDSGDGDCMLFCDACDKGYHMKCHLPRVNEKPKGKWVCGQCATESENCQAQPMEFETATLEESSMPTTNGNHRDNVETTSPPGLPTPQDSPAQPEPEDKPCVKEESVSLPMLRDFQGPYPDAANWSIDDVVNFFKSAGFVTQAEAFREQEIDGKSLLLMKRSDVLTGLSLKLGPALKMYTHVQNLQLVGQSSYVNGTGH